MENIAVTQSDACVITVTVLGGASPSGEHKVKLGGLIVGEGEGGGRVQMYEGMAMGEQVANGVVMSSGATG